MKQLTLIDTFSGIGGFSLAGRWAGYRTVCFSEVDPYASAVLRKHWPDVPNLGDIKNADFTPYAGATVLTGGFPCQPYSVAGHRKGRDDDRYLWPALLSAIQNARPAWVVGENVTGIINMELDHLLADLAGVGYTSLPFVIPACATGADHRRLRVWIVAHADRHREQQQEGSVEEERGRDLLRIGPLTSHPASPRLQSPRKYRAHARKVDVHTEPSTPGFPRRDTYPDLLRKVHGVSRRMDRIKSLGNAIVPQVAFQILQAIAKVEAL